MMSAMKKRREQGMREYCWSAAIDPVVQETVHTEAGKAGLSRARTWEVRGGTWRAREMVWEALGPDSARLCI